MTSEQVDKRIAIIGGGLAGIAAAATAIQRGFRVELFEKAKTLGGRAGSFVDHKTGDTVDFCQHLAMGCCTEFLDFCRQTGIDDCFERAGTIHFIGPNGRQCDFAPCHWLPPPLHLLPGLLRLDYLSWGERWSIVRTMGKLIRLDIRDENKISRGPTARGMWSPLSLTPAALSVSPHRGPLAPGYCDCDEDATNTIGAWLRRQGQTDRTIERFWAVVLLSALSETVDLASLAAAQKVFRDGFWASRSASELWLPRRPLSEIFHNRTAKWLANHGVELHLGTPVEKIVGNGRRADTLVLADGTRREFDAVVVAVPWRRVRRLFDENLSAAIPALAEVERIEPAAITAVHLWFDRPITRLPHAALVGRLGQWLFSRPPDEDKASSLHYYQVVVSASHRMTRHSHAEWLSEIRGELNSIWPAARRANLVHGRVITQPAAVFSVTPELESMRPGFTQRTPVENLSLAGDWTATGWPATMEGSVRSGRQAVEAIL